MTTARPSRVMAAVISFVLGITLLTMATTSASQASVQNSGSAVDYERDVRPILDANCFGCHGPRQAQSGLRLDLRQNMMRGGDYGVVIVPGKSAESKLIKRLVGIEAGIQMPPTGRLSDADIDVLRRWIDAGANMPGRATEGPAAAAETAPAVQRAIDAIVAHDDTRVTSLITAEPSLARTADGIGSTLLMHAAASGTMATMRALVDAGADVNAKNRRNATALHWALADAAKVKWLLSRGAVIESKTVEGRTALYAASTMTDGAATVRVLIEAGANVNAATIVGTTPLFPAVNANADVTRMLLDAGADPNHASLSGVTPLLFTRDSVIVKMLIDRGANVRAKSKVGETALMDAAVRGDVAAARLLIERGADVNAVDHRGYTALILAAHFDRDNADLVRLLLDNGADANAIAEGQTALSLAAKRGDTSVTKMLRTPAGTPAAAVSNAAVVTAAANNRITEETLRMAVARSLDLLLKTSPAFIKKGGCNSCHNQFIPAAAQAFARQRGIVVGEPIAQLPSTLQETSTERYSEYSVTGGGGTNSLGYELFGSELAGQPADARIHAEVRYIKTQQEADGHWRGGGALSNHAQLALARPGAARPPLTFDDFTPTAYMIRALNAYGARGDADDTKARIDRARQWLLGATPTRTQEHAFKLLGLAWSSADRPAIDAAARELGTLQRADGGFAQLPTLPSDAYATGIALFALSQAGVESTSPAYQAGLRYLLSTQAADGTWHVKSRSLEFQPYFESGYPYGRDQWISAAGAAYATFALASAVPPAVPSRLARK